MTGIQRQAWSFDEFLQCFVDESSRYLGGVPTIYTLRGERIEQLGGLG
jgi:hypothetical protein